MLNRRGMALLVTLMMAAFIGISAMALFSTVNMETMIAANIRRLSQAKISAASGLNHFGALNLNYNTLRQRAGDQQTVLIIPKTNLSRFTSYEVKVHFYPHLSERQYLVESIGYYTKKDKILSIHPIKALFEGAE